MHTIIPFTSQTPSTRKKPSNKMLLQVAASSFFIFVILEIVGALKSKSLSLLGDAIAMSVDVFTYFANMYAESTKDEAQSRNLFSRIVNEIGIPSFSVLCLLSVTIYITQDAIEVLKNPPEINDVPVEYMYGFALLNLVIDIVCGVFFYLRGREVFYEPLAPLPLISLEISLDSEEEEREFGHLEEDLDLTLKGTSSTYLKNNQNYSVDRPEGLMKKNLNMLSAFTHVGGDTVRTISVIGAAATSTILNIDADVCDAWAAVVVAVTIVLLTLPLIYDIFEASKNILSENKTNGGTGTRYHPIPLFPRDKDRDRDHENIGKGVMF